MLILFTLQVNFFFYRNILINHLLVIWMVHHGKLVPIALILIIPKWISSNSCKSLKTRDKRIVVTCDQIVLSLHLIVIINGWSVAKLFETVQTVIIVILGYCKLWCRIRHKLGYRTVWLKLRFVVLIFFKMMSHRSVIIYSRDLWNVHLGYAVECYISKVYRYFLVVMSLSVLALTSRLRSKTSFFIDFIA